MAESWREAGAVVANDPFSLLSRTVFVRGYGDATITEYKKASKGSSWPDKFTIVRHGAEKEEEVVLWDGSNGGVWFRFIEPADMGNEKRALGRKLSSNVKDVPQGTLVFTVHEANGEEFGQDSFFSIVQVHHFQSLPYITNHVWIYRHFM
jgi:hypothetical protein